MKFGMPFEVVQSPEPTITSAAIIRLLVGMGQKVGFEVMMSRKSRGTVRTYALLASKSIWLEDQHRH